MKNKSLNNHLYFKKETVVNLDRLKMAAVVAGCPPETIEETCPQQCEPDRGAPSQSTCFPDTIIPDM